VKIGTPVAAFLLLHPGVEVKPVKGDALSADADLNEIRAHLAIEAIAVHAEIEGGIPKADQTGQETAFACKRRHRGRGKTPALNPSAR
jgi:hypothetical protein